MWIRPQLFDGFACTAKVAGCDQVLHPPQLDAIFQNALSPTMVGIEKAHSFKCAYSIAIASERLG
jgi:hypothetical protein